ncbi:type II secretion system protein F [Candidatus Endobugula sertula]|uniref:Type II secretion system protein F n=1 Tax=Candidatus Endobugula sertula TaxID=62101 RepID=A0A1D2QP18_9GAMM|nr:type II secretion system protein F [Candidatus Endobugula sertula]
MATPESTVFIYKGVDRKGKKVEGEISGGSQTLIKAQLLKQGVRTHIVRKKPKPLFSRDKKIKPMDIAVFTRQMATMMKAGVPLVQSFDIVADGVDNPTMKTLITHIRTDVAAGTGFAVALRKHPKYFDYLFCNLVESGEQSGALEALLDRIATYKEKTEALKAKIKKALTYPITVVIVAFIVTGILLVKVVPQFAETFSSFGADLPAFTLVVLRLSESAQQWWYIILLATVGGVFALKALHQHSPNVRLFVDKLMLKIPVVGQIVYNSILARYARTLSTTFAAGVPLIDALQSVSGATGNRVYEEAVLNIRDDVSTGIQLNTSMRTSRLFPGMMLQMVAIGEESGALDDMLDKSATYHEDIVDSMVDNLTSLLEPLIMSVLGVLVGGLLIAMYLPIFQIGQVV